MELLCYEIDCNCRAYADRGLLGDDRVLKNLLSEEERYTANMNYFECVQGEISPDMRRIVADWMMEICDEQRCQEDVFVLSMNYLDRFLSVCPIKKSHLQLLGATCLLIASKLREPRPLSSELLVIYTANSITLTDIRKWETYVLAKLKWEVSAVTPHAFLSPIASRLPLNMDCEDYQVAHRHAQTFIDLCTRDHKFLMYTPSMICAASIAAALSGLNWTSKNNISLSELLNRLQEILSIEMDYLQTCLTQIEDMMNLAKSTNLVQVPNEASGDRVGTPVDQAAKQTAHHGKAGTPTDVRDIHF